MTSGEDCQAKVVIEGLNVKVGEKHGNALSVILFNLVLDYITKKLGIREFFHLCLALTENVIKTPVYHRNLSFQLARMSLCQEFSPKPA